MRSQFDIWFWLIVNTILPVVCSNALVYHESELMTFSLSQKYIRTIHFVSY